MQLSTLTNHAGQPKSPRSIAQLFATMTLLLLGAYSLYRLVTADSGTSAQSNLAVPANSEDVCRCYGVTCRHPPAHGLPTQGSTCRAVLNGCPGAGQHNAAPPCGPS